MKGPPAGIVAQARIGRRRRIVTLLEDGLGLPPHPPSSCPARAPRHTPLPPAAAAAVLFLVAASGRDFWSPDEPDFAEHVREMLERKSLLLPYENGKPYSEKPILFYWAMAATTPLSRGDVHPPATRLPSV